MLDFTRKEVIVMDHILENANLTSIELNGFSLPAELT